MTNSYIKPDFVLFELIPESALLQTSGIDDSDTEMEDGGEI